MFIKQDILHIYFDRVKKKKKAWFLSMFSVLYTYYDGVHKSSWTNQEDLPKKKKNSYLWLFGYICGFWPSWEFLKILLVWYFQNFGDIQVALYLSS